MHAFQRQLGAKVGLGTLGSSQEYFTLVPTTCDSPLNPTSLQKCGPIASSTRPCTLPTPIPWAPHSCLYMTLRLFLMHEFYKKQLIFVGLGRRRLLSQTNSVAQFKELTLSKLMLYRSESQVDEESWQDNRQSKLLLFFEFNTNNWFLHDPNDK